MEQQRVLKYHSDFKLHVYALLCLHERHSVLQLHVFFLFFCQPYPKFRTLPWREKPSLLQFPNPVIKQIWPFQRRTQASGQGCPQKKYFCDLVLCSAKMKQTFKSTIINNSSLICLFCLLILFIFQLYSQWQESLPKEYLAWLKATYSQTWETPFRWEHFYLIGGDRATIQSKTSLPIVVGQQAIHLFTINSKIQETLPVGGG